MVTHLKLIYQIVLSRSVTKTFFESPILARIILQKYSANIGINLWENGAWKNLSNLLSNHSDIPNELAKSDTSKIKYC